MASDFRRNLLVSPTHPEEAAASLSAVTLVAQGSPALLVAQSRQAARDATFIQPTNAYRGPTVCHSLL